MITATLRPSHKFNRSQVMSSVPSIAFWGHSSFVRCEYTNTRTIAAPLSRSSWGHIHRLAVPWISFISMLKATHCHLWHVWAIGIVQILNMRMWLYVYLYVYGYACVLYVCIYIHIYTHIYMRVCVRVRMRTCKCTGKCMHYVSYIYIYVCVYLYEKLSSLWHRWVLDVLVGLRSLVLQESPFHRVLQRIHDRGNSSEAPDCARKTA